MAIVHRIIPVGPFQCNCHVLADEATRTGVIIDPGDEAEVILDAVRDLGIRVTHLLHTHCHLDHITGTRKVKEATGAEILIHPKDRRLYEHLRDQYATTLRLFGVPLGDADDPLPIDGQLRDGDSVPLGEKRLEVRHTPGHTPGSCSFTLEGDAQRMAFTGDTLFARSIGRTDLEGGDFQAEIESIRKRLLTLDPETIIYPGHGPRTRVREEREQNPFLQ